MMQMARDEFGLQRLEERESDYLNDGGASVTFRLMRMKSSGVAAHLGRMTSSTLRPSSVRPSL